MTVAKARTGKQPAKPAPTKRAATTKGATPRRTAAPAAKKPARAAAGSSGTSPSQLISARIAALGDWRGEVLARVRKLIHAAEPEIVEEWKWRGVPVWSRGGIVCTGESYKEVVKLTFFKGASLPDPAKLFNASLDGNARRAIDIRADEKINAPALQALIRAAVALNLTAKKSTSRAGRGGDSHAE